MTGFSWAAARWPAPIASFGGQSPFRGQAKALYSRDSVSVFTVTAIHLGPIVADGLFAFTRALRGQHQRALFKLLGVEIAGFTPHSSGSSLWL